MILNRDLRLLSFSFGCEGAGSGSYNLGIQLLVSRPSGYGVFQALVSVAIVVMRVIDAGEG